MSKYLEKPPEMHPIFQPLTKPSMMLGIPSKLFYGISFIGLQTALVLWTLKLLPLCLIAYFLAKNYAKQDPYFDKVYMQTNRQKDFYL